MPFGTRTEKGCENIIGKWTVWTMQVVLSAAEDNEVVTQTSWSNNNTISVVYINI